MHTAVLKSHLPKAQSFQKACEVLHMLGTRPGPEKIQMPGKEERAEGRNWQWLHTHTVQTRATIRPAGVCARSGCLISHSTVPLKQTLLEPPVSFFGE